jgi:tetratricopeptide (TPR) repeat protein
MLVIVCKIIFDLFQKPYILVAKSERVLREDAFIIAVMLVRLPSQLRQSEHLSVGPEKHGHRGFLWQSRERRGFGKPPPSGSITAAMLFRNAALTLLIAVTALAADSQDDVLHRAAQLDSEQKCGEAERYYAQALTRGRHTLPLLNNLGNHYLVCGNLQKAQLYFEQVLQMNPAHTNANLQLARIAVDRRQGTKAIEYLSHLPDSDPWVRTVRAEALYWTGKPTLAASVLEGVQKDIGPDSQLLFLFGHACTQIGLYEPAETAFNALLVQNPANFDALLGLGRAAALAQHYDRAERALDTALHVQPGNSDALFELAQVRYAQHDYSRAVYLLAKARVASPKNPNILLALARAAQAAEYYGDSALAYDEYLRIRPRDENARRDRALVYGLTETHLAQGVQELNRYIRRHPSDPLAYYDLAQLSWKRNPEQALDQLSMALRLDPSFAAASYSRGWLLHRLGRDVESLVDLQVAQQSLPDNVGLLASLGLCYLSLDRPSEAENVLRHALTVSPQDPEVLMHLGRALMDLGRDDEAQSVLQEFQRIRPQKIRGPVLEPRMIALANLSPAQEADHEIDRLRQESRAHPDDTELQLAIARLLLNSGKAEEATAVFRQLLAMDAGPLIWREAGTSLLHAGEYGLAKEFLQRAGPQEPDARIDLATTLFFLGDLHQALAVLAQVPARLQQGDSMLIKARILDALGRKTEAVELLRAGLHQSISRPQVVQEAVVMLIGDGSVADALDLTREALVTHPDEPELSLTEAIIMGLLNQEAFAEKSLKKIESEWPEWDQPYLVHGLLLEGTPRQREAEQNLRLARALGSTDLAGVCALTRIKNSPTPGPMCNCTVGLRALILHSCDTPRASASPQF